MGMQKFKVTEFNNNKKRKLSMKKCQREHIDRLIE